MYTPGKFYFLIFFLLIFSCHHIKNRTELMELRINGDGLLDVFDIREIGSF